MTLFLLLLFFWVQISYIKEERESIAKAEKMAIRISNLANMVLFAAKVYASFRSGSLAIIASTLDSLLDLLSGFILWFTAFSMQTPNPYRYPIGKRRMQPLVSFYKQSFLSSLSKVLMMYRKLFFLFYDISRTTFLAFWIFIFYLNLPLLEAYL